LVIRSPKGEDIQNRGVSLCMEPVLGSVLVDGLVQAWQHHEDEAGYA
jgi:hypothetical protein